MSLDPYNHLLKVWESIRTPIPKVGTHLGVWGSFLHSLLHSQASFLAHKLCKPMVKVATRGHLHVHNLVSKTIKYTPRRDTLFINVVKPT